MSTEKRVTYQASNSYSVLNEFTEKTKNVWLVFHGMGYLSRYFIEYFSEMNADENYIIAPQAPSKYYQKMDFRHVGASWLTKVDTEEETKNVLAYIDAVWEAEKPSGSYRFIVLGYSQGVSIAMRWLSSRKIQCDLMVLHSGGIPKELTAESFSYLKESAKITSLYGDQDKYITEARLKEEENKMHKLFGNRVNIEVFEGKHEVATHIIKGLKEFN